MTTTNGGQQGAGQTLGNALGQSMPFGTQSMGQGQPQAMGGQQQLDPQFLGALLPIIATVAQGVISQLNAPQGQPQAAMGGQQQGVSPQFLPGLSLPFPLPSPQDLIGGFKHLFQLSAQPGQPQATAGGQQQLDPQFLGALLPIIATVAQGVISQLNAPQGQPQAAMGGQQQGVSPQFLPGIPGFPFLPTPSPGNVLRGVGKIGEGIGDFFGLSAQPGQPQAGAGGQQQIDPQFFELVKFLPGLIEPVVGMIKQLSAQTGQPSFAQPQGVQGGAAQPMATAGWR